jgi:RHS repeat-associated protein
VATYRDDDSDPKEQFVYHNAGTDGLGGASYIDDVVLRDKDANTAWHAQSDGTLEERIYYCQNWRHDVVALITDGGEQVEQVRYTSYGIPLGIPAGDIDHDFDVDSADATAFDGLGSYEVYADLDLDGDNDATDRATIVNNDGNNLGFTALSLADVGNRKGYAGYEHDIRLAAANVFYHVRRRVYSATFGRWLTRDPLGYVDGINLYGYAFTNPSAFTDPLGLKCSDSVIEPLDIEPPFPGTGASTLVPDVQTPCSTGTPGVCRPKLKYVKPPTFCEETEGFLNYLRLEGEFEADDDEFLVTAEAWANLWWNPFVSYDVPLEASYTIRCDDNCVPAVDPDVTGGDTGKDTVLEAGAGAGWKHIGGKLIMRAYYWATLNAKGPIGIKGKIGGGVGVAKGEVEGWAHLPDASAKVQFPLGPADYCCEDPVDP